MLDIQQFKSELSDMPLAAREELAELLYESVTSDHEKLAAEEEAQHLKIVEARFKEYDAGGIEAVPFGDVLDRIFGEERNTV